LILKRNKLGDKFAEELGDVLKEEKYIKYIDLSCNKIKEDALRKLLKSSLLQN